MVSFLALISKDDSDSNLTMWHKKLTLYSKGNENAAMFLHTLHADVTAICSLLVAVNELTEKRESFYTQGKKKMLNVDHYCFVCNGQRL